MSPAECLRRAIAHGSAAAQQPGSTMPGRADVDRLLPLISVRELDVTSGRATA
jgi:fructose-1-phosphate kinase PfkB-like protein